MADTLSLIAKLFFDGSQAVTGMGKVSGAFAGMQQGIKRTSQGMQQVSKGFRGSNYALLGVGSGVVATTKRLIEFEGAMGAVKSVYGAEFAGRFDELEKKAIQLGIDTQYTNTQAAQALENLARSGMTVDEALEAIGPTLNAAAAEGLDLATAAVIVSSNMRAFGFEAKDTQRIADGLAYVSAKTNTNMVDLQESLKFAAPAARTANVSFEETASILGAFADVGLRGSLAGTGFKNAIVKMAQGAKDGVIEVGGLNAAIEYTDTGMLNAQYTFMNVVKALSKIPEPLKRVQVGMDLLGIRGQPVTTALEALTPEKTATLFEGMGGKAAGKAAEMAKIRLGNIHGQLTLLTASVDIAAQGFAKLYSPQLEAGFRWAYTWVNDVTAAFGIFAKAGTLGASEVEFQLGKLNVSSVEVTRGIREGWASAKAIFGGVADAVGSVLSGVRAMFHPIDSIMGKGSAPMSTSNLVKTAFQFGAIALSIKVVGGALGRMKDIAVGSFKILQGALGTVKSGLTGTVGVLAKRFPALSRLGGPLGKLGGAVSGLDKLTAQPVRVTNWDEAGGVLGGTGARVLPGQQQLPLGGPQSTPAAAKGLLGKAAGAAYGAVQVAAVGMLAYEVGTFLDKTFKISDRISESLMSAERAASSARVLAFSKQVGYQAMTEQANQLIAFAQKGIDVQTEAGGPRRKVTQELIQERLMRYATSKNVGMDAAKARMVVTEVMAQMGPKLAAAIKNVKLENTINLDSRPVAKGLAGAENEHNERLGNKPAPGARRSAAAR